MATLAAYWPLGTCCLLASWHLLLTGLLARLQAESPEVQRGDYYDEHLASWDREGLQSDLKLARSPSEQAAKKHRAAGGQATEHVKEAGTFILDVRVLGTERALCKHEHEHETSVASTTRSEAAGGSMEGGVEGGVEGASDATVPQSFAETMRAVLARRGRQSVIFGLVGTGTAAAGVATAGVVAAGAAEEGAAAAGSGSDAVASEGGEGGEGGEESADGGPRRKKKRRGAPQPGRQERRRKAAAAPTTSIQASQL